MRVIFTRELLRHPSYVLCTVQYKHNLQINLLLVYLILLSGAGTTQRSIIGRFNEKDIGKSVCGTIYGTTSVFTRMD
jgi:hypothetical protein